MCISEVKSQDSENAQRNLEIAQISRLCGTYTQIWMLNYHLVLRLNLATFPLSFLVPTECRVPPWTTVLIVVGAIAVGIAMVISTGLLVEIIHWHYVSPGKKGESLATRY